MDTFEDARPASCQVEPASMLVEQREPFMPALAISRPVTILTVADLVCIYLDSIELRYLAGMYKPGSRERVRHYCLTFIRDFGTRPLEACRSSDLTRWLLDHPEWKAASTKSDAVTVVLSCFKWLCRERHIVASPYWRPSGLPAPKPRPPITPEEYACLMAWARNRTGRRRRPSATALRIACYFLWRSGARTCEMRLALRCDIDWERGVIVLDRHKTDESGEPRLIGLDDRLLRLLRLLERTRRPNSRPCRCEEAKHRPHSCDAHIFRNGRRGCWTRRSFGRLFSTYARLAGIDPKKSAYCLRHGFCVRSIHLGIGEKEIADAMGHASTRYIAWYGRGSKQKASYLRDVMQRANGKEVHFAHEPPPSVASSRPQSAHS